MEDISNHPRHVGAWRAVPSIIPMPENTGHGAPCPLYDDAVAGGRMFIVFIVFTVFIGFVVAGFRLFAGLSGSTRSTWHAPQGQGIIY
jgi:hypothetical protein